LHLLVRYRLPTGSVSTIDLERGENLVLGRDEKHADLVIEDSKCSRAHCCFTRSDGGALLIEDLDSSNGTWVAGHRIATTTALDAGDVVMIGHTEFKIEEAPHDQSDTFVGRTLRDIEILEVLGRGACGVVYRGLQTNLGREVGVKMLLPKLAENRKRRDAFMREARNAGRLTHANLIQIHDVFECEGTHLMVMEFAEGGSAADAVQSEGAFDLSEALKLMVDMSSALHYAHQSGLVHRDVKPANILVVGEDAFKLADLGIAARMSEDGIAVQRRFAGSPAYLAPEQALGKPIDGRADIYALGASVWHVLTGKPLFEGSAREVIKQQIHASVPDLKRLVPGIPGPILSLIYRMLAKQPDQRIGDAGQVMDIARQALEARQGAGAGTVAGSCSARVRSAGRYRRRKSSSTRLRRSGRPSTRRPGHRGR
jgi:hypothetical protein